MTDEQTTYFAEQVAYPLTGIALAIIVLAGGAEILITIDLLLEVL